MQGIRHIPLDNPIFRFFRKLVYRIDNMLFNYKNSIGPHYEPTHYLLVVPFWAGFALSMTLIVLSFSGKMPLFTNCHFYICLGGIVAINVLIMMKRIMDMPTWIKRIFYLVFVIIVSAVFLQLVTFVFFNLCLLSIVLFVIYVAFCLFMHAPITGPSFGGGSDGYREETWVDDGSILGKTLYRNDSSGSWRDNSGTEYEETSEGFKKK